MNQQKQDSRFLYRIRDAGLNEEAVGIFRDIIYGHYRSFGRKLPWRGEADPYRVFISEVMLQQTQVDRVIEKYREFIREFPDFQALSSAPLERVLSVWKGLGYNRRALTLQKSARLIVDLHGSVLPSCYQELIALPGLGPATASSILAFAFNKPVVFIETNIRTVFIHFFFPNDQTVEDSEILPLVEITLDRKYPGKWYNALMDYGVLLKKQHKNPGRRSKHYKKQAAFEGSKRQLRGKVIEVVLKTPGVSVTHLNSLTALRGAELSETLDELRDEGFITIIKKKIYINRDIHRKIADDQ